MEKTHHFGSLTTVVLVVLLVTTSGLLGYAAGLQAPRTEDGQKNLVAKRPAKKTAAYTGPDLMSYVDNPAIFTVKKTVVSAAEVLKPSDWATKDGMHTNQFYTTLLRKYTAQDTGVRYEFTATARSQAPRAWVVTVISNKLGYATAEAFQKDFPADGVGAPLYAAAVSASNLEFVSSCGSGYADGSDLPVGCDKVREAVEPTIKLK